MSDYPDHMMVPHRKSCKTKRWTWEVAIPTGMVRLDGFCESGCQAIIDVDERGYADYLTAGGA